MGFPGAVGDDALAGAVLRLEPDLVLFYHELNDFLPSSLRSSDNTEIGIGMTDRELYESKRESLDRKKLELQEIVTKKIPENSRAIAAAREHGDLRENSEYKMAKQDQTVLMAQKSQLEKDLANARITDFSEASTDMISVGSIVSLRNVGSGQTPTYKVMGAWDSDPDNFVIAYKTPLGQALLGKRLSDKVKVKIGSTVEEYEITSISRHVDQKV